MFLAAMSFVKTMFISFSLHIILAILYTKVNTNDISTELAAENKSEVFLTDDTVHNWSSPQYPNPYPPQNQVLIIKCDVGYSVLFSIKNLDLDGANGDFLVIKPGITLDGDSEGRIFTYNLKDKYRCLINSSSVIVSLRVSGKNEAEKTGFSLYYKRYNESEKPSDEFASFELSENKPPYLTVFVSRKAQPELNTTKVQADFKTAINQMAAEYCKSNGFLLTKEIIDEDIEILDVTPCPISNSEFEDCLKIQFSVSLHIAENSTWSGNELSMFQLEQMWHDLGNKYLEQHEMRIYIQVDNNSNLTSWIIILCSTIILVCGIVFVLKVFGTNIPKYDFRKHKMNGIGTKPHHYKSNKTLKMNNQPCSQSVPPNFPDDYYYCSYKQSDSDDEILYPNSDKKTKKANNPTTNVIYA